MAQHTQNHGLTRVRRCFLVVCPLATPLPSRPLDPAWPPHIGLVSDQRRGKFSSVSPPSRSLWSPPTIPTPWPCFPPLLHPDLPPLHHTAAPFSVAGPGWPAAVRRPNGVSSVPYAWAVSRRELNRRRHCAWRQITERAEPPEAFDLASDHRKTPLRPGLTRFWPQKQGF